MIVDHAPDEKPSLVDTCRIIDLGSLELRAIEAGALQVCARQSSAAKVCVVQVGIAEIGAGEIRLVELGASQVGTGQIGKHHIRRYSEIPEAELVALCDIREDEATRVADYHGVPSVYVDYHDLLARDDIQSVDVCLHNRLHAPVTVDALEAGKNVYCEKPMSWTYAEARAMYDTAQRLGKKLHALSSVDEGVSGGPYPIQDPPAELNYDFWLGQAPKVDFCSNRVGGNFRWWLEYAGGEVTDWGAHHTDIALWALGSEETGAIEAASAEAAWHRPAGPNSSVATVTSGRTWLGHSSVSCST